MQASSVSILTEKNNPKTAQGSKRKTFCWRKTTAQIQKPHMVNNWFMNSIVRNCLKKKIYAIYMHDASLLSRSITVDPQTNQQEILTHCLSDTCENLCWDFMLKTHNRGDYKPDTRLQLCKKKTLLDLCCRWLFSPRKCSLTKGSWPLREYVLQCWSATSLLFVYRLGSQSHIRYVNKAALLYPPTTLFNCSSELPTSSGMSCSLLRHPKWGATGGGGAKIMAGTLSRAGGSMSALCTVKAVLQTLHTKLWQSVQLN